MKGQLFIFLEVIEYPKFTISYFRALELRPGLSFLGLTYYFA